MKNKALVIKIMFGLSILFVLLFSSFYLWGTENCGNIYALFDCTLPFLALAVISIIGFGAAQHYYINSADVKTRLPMLGKSKKEKRYEKRYIVKTYARDGVHTKHINLRGDYGMLRSA